MRFTPTWRGPPDSKGQAMTTALVFWVKHQPLPGVPVASNLTTSQPNRQVSKDKNND